MEVPTTTKARSSERENKDSKRSSASRNSKQRSSSLSPLSDRSRSRSGSRERSSRKHRSRSRSTSQRRSHKSRSHRPSRRSHRSRSRSRDRSRGRRRSTRHHDSSNRKRSRRDRSRSADGDRESSRKHHRRDRRSRDREGEQHERRRRESLTGAEEKTASRSEPTNQPAGTAQPTISRESDIEEAPTSQESVASSTQKPSSQWIVQSDESALVGTVTAETKTMEEIKEKACSSFTTVAQSVLAPKVDVKSIKMDILKALADARSTIASIKKVETTSVKSGVSTDVSVPCPVAASVSIEVDMSVPVAAPVTEETPVAQVAFEVSASSTKNEVAASDVDEFDMFSAAELHQAGVPLSPVKLTAAAVADGALPSTYDDPEGYYNPNIGEVLDGKYRVLGTVGKGVFSTVLRCQRMIVPSTNGSSDIVAIKLIRSNEVMREASQTEIKILTELAEKDPRDKKHCVRLLERFEHRNHVALVFESMQMNVREAMKKFGGKGGISIQAVRIFSKHLLIALSHLETCGIVHADIKPDNVLLDEKQTMIKLCDFGSAFKVNHDKHDPTPYLVSRFYRAPEIVLGLAYDKAVDMWSVGCCLYEMFTGKVMFPGATNNEMLKLFMELKGKVPNKIIKKHRQAYIDQFQMEPHFTDDNKFRSHDLDRISGKPVLRLMDSVKTKFDLGAALMSAKSSTDDRKLVMELRNLLERMFTLDPAKRITPKEALAHPFVKANG